MSILERVQRLFGAEVDHDPYPVYREEDDEQIKESKRVIASLVMPLELNPDRMAAEELYGVLYREVGRRDAD